MKAKVAVINWNAIWNRVFRLMDTSGDSYYSGGRFMKAMQEVDPYSPTYGDYIEERRKAGQSTSRRDYFRDLFLALPEAARFKLLSNILNTLEANHPDACAEIRAAMSGGSLAPSAMVPGDAWNADRLNEYLKDMDGAIATGEYERTVTMAYTCLEGFLGAFIRAKSQRASYPNEIIALSKEVCELLKSINKQYPDEVLNLIKHTAHAVDKARNRFSEAHFGSEAGLWLATYMRDVVNTQIRLLLHFM